MIYLSIFVFVIKMELEKQKMRHKDDQGLLVSENEELSGKIEELKKDIVSIIFHSWIICNIGVYTLDYENSSCS